MDNNDKFRRIRYLFDVDDAKMLQIFKDENQFVTKEMLSKWFLKDDDPAYLKIADIMLAIFLNAMIVEKRGRREGPQPEPETKLDNNIILKKLKIAFNLKTDEVINLFKLAGRKIGPHELSAFFRNPSQSQYRTCNDQYLRNFLKGLQLKYRK